MIPHVAKATGVYLNSLLATTEARQSGVRRGDHALADGYVADGPGENIFVVKDGRLLTPPLSMSILPGITRDTIIQIGEALGYTVEEAMLIRTDLYLADEVFMVGTATEVAPVRAVDDREIGVGPVTLELQKAYLAACTASTTGGATGSTSSRCRARRPRRSGRAPAGPALEPLARRAGGGARPRRPALGPPLARPHDRPLRGGVRRGGRRAVRGGGVERDRRPPPPLRHAGVGPGDEVITSPYSFVASANCAIYQGATPVFADLDRRTLNLDPAAVEAAITERTRAVVAVDIFGYPCELDELRALCERHGIALIQDACEALGARYRGRPVGSHGRRRSSRSTRTSRSRPARAAW